MLPSLVALLSLAVALLPPPAALRSIATDCIESGIIREALDDIGKLNESTKRRALDMTDVDNVFAYLERFIQVLDPIDLSAEQAVAKKLRKILAARNSCTGWTKPGWELMHEENLYQSLENLLKFLNHYAYSLKKV